MFNEYGFRPSRIPPFSIPPEYIPDGGKPNGGILNGGILDGRKPYGGIIDFEGNFPRDD